MGEEVIHLVESIKENAKRAVKKLSLLCVACRHRGTPLYAKIFAGVVVAYALSPIDLIPDFIPILGYLDDLILIPLGIALAFKIIPSSVLEECSKIEQERLTTKGFGKNAAAFVIVALWIFIIVKLLSIFFKLC